MRLALKFIVCVGHFTVFINALNTKLLENVSNPLSEPIKKFIKFIIETNYKQHESFVITKVNAEVQPEFLDYTTQIASQYKPCLLTNGLINRPHLDNSIHFGINLLNPEGRDGFRNNSYFIQKSNSAKKVIISTRPQSPINIHFQLLLYNQISPHNIISAYEEFDAIHVFTLNPNFEFINLTSSMFDLKPGLFADEMTNLYKNEINALLTYPDRTKIRKLETNQYQGKDFDAIKTIVESMNGKLNIIALDNEALNPWYDSVKLENRDEEKSKILKANKIEILIKSEDFSDSNQAVDSLYPHTQNDFVALVPLSKDRNYVKLYSGLAVYVHYFLMPPFFYFLILLIRRLYGNRLEFWKLFSIVSPIIFSNSNAVASSSIIRPIERYVLMGLLFYYFNINVIVLAVVTNLLTITALDTHINSVAELLAGNLPLHATTASINIIQSQYGGPLYSKLVQALTPLSLHEGALDRALFQGPKVQYLIDRDRAEYISKFRLFHQNKDVIYQIVPKSFVLRLQSYKIVHNSRLTKVFNRKLRQLSEGGFISLWRQRSIEQGYIEGSLVSNIEIKTKTFAPATVQQRQLAFVVIFRGLCIAAFSLLLEILFYKAFHRCNWYQALLDKLK